LPKAIPKYLHDATESVERFPSNLGNATHFRRYKVSEDMGNAKHSEVYS